MKYDEFVANVRRRGEHADNDESERVIRVVLSVLGRRLTDGEAADLAAQMPDEVTETLIRQSRGGGAFGVEEFVSTVADRLSASGADSARWDSSAVLSTLADSIDGGELNKILSQLPSGYAELFGHSELA